MTASGAQPPRAGVYLARAALSRLMEPADLPGQAMIKVIGPWQAMRVISGYETLNDTQQSSIAGLLQEQAGKQWRGVEEHLQRWRPRLPGLAPERDLRFISSRGGGLMIPEAEHWPTALRDLGLNEPIALWYRGGQTTSEPVLAGLGQCISVVGARDATAYGEAVATEFCHDLVIAGKTIISGGAYGIDAAAHRAALQASSIVEQPTIAVMAGGLDRFYPAGNEELLANIAERSLVLAEVPPGSNPTRYRFLQRNRLIAALSAATVVVEARWRSGALSTAHHAVNLGREVAAVPGSVQSPHSAGCHRLLREGAACVTEAAEILELVSPLGDVDIVREARRSETDGLPVEDLLLLDALPLHHITTIQKLSSVAGLSTAAVQAGLGRLEVLGLAQRKGRGWCRDQIRK